MSSSWTYVLMSIVLTGTGCQAIIVPPALDDSHTPARVLVIDYGRHASLCLPRADHGYREYAYGQWDWYAMERTEWWRGPAVILWPSASALSRRDWEPDDSRMESIQAFIDSVGGAEEILSFEVDQARSDALLVALDARYAEGEAREEPVSDTHGKTFVRDDEPYWLQRQCNTVLVGWLEELGCRVTTIPLEASYAIHPTERVVDVPSATIGHSH